MTKTPYDAEALDGLAWRLFDVACTVRLLAKRAAKSPFAAVEVNDRKALEWIESLERWSRRTEQDVGAS